MNVGFIGVGYMGRHMVKHIIKGGNKLTVYDIDSEATQEIQSLGASLAASPKEVAQSSEVIFTSLPKPQNVEEVFLGEGGILEGSADGTTYFDLSTTDPLTLERMTIAAERKGVKVLDAPVSGGTLGAELGTLCIMVGGDKLAYEKFKPILDLMGTEVMYSGPSGSGAICKIANNLIGMTLGVVLSEAFSMGVKAGVDPDTLFKAISMSTGDTKAMKSYPETLFKGNFNPGFKLDLGAKDVGLATKIGRDLGVPLDISNLVQQKYIEAQNRGWGEQSTLAVAKLQEEKSDTKIRSKT